MKIETISPTAKLSNIVKCYWTLEKGKGTHRERLYPCGESQIIFHYGNPFKEIYGNNIITQPQSIVCSQMTTYKDVIADDSAGLFGIIFHSYAIGSFLHIPPHELLQHSFNLNDANKIFESLEDKISNAADANERIKVFEEFLIKRINMPKNYYFNIIKDSVEFFETSVNCPSIKQIAGKYSLSERQFERIFKDYVGLPPKSFAEIMRFKRAFFSLKKHNDLTKISYSSGYYDQSHFIRTFKKLSGYTPGEFLKLHR